jgi:hypothetical protein
VRMQLEGKALSLSLYCLSVIRDLFFLIKKEGVTKVTTLPKRDHNNTCLLETNDRRALNIGKPQALSQTT